MLYHDWEAQTYDEKWSISFDQRCVDYACQRFSAVAGSAGWPFGTSLEVGCGTGFFTLNLKLAGVLDECHVTDISPGMVAAARRNASQLGFEISGRPADAGTLPYADDTFDVVIGHAVIHHIPDVERAFAEMLRVLKPGGRLVICGEPTRYGTLRIGRWVHLGDENRIRCHEGSLRIGDKSVFGRDDTVNCYLDMEFGAATIVSDSVYICDFDM